MASPLVSGGVHYGYPGAPSVEEAYEAGIKQGRVEAEKQFVATSRPGMIDNLKELLANGDIVVRKVSNGFIIRRIPTYSGHMIETWVVEGDDIKAVGDQLTAMQATDAMTPEVDREAGSLADGMRAMMDMSSDRAAKILAKHVDSATLANIIARNPNSP